MNLDELLKAAIKDPSQRSIFLQTLIKSDVYVICKNPVNRNAEKQRVESSLNLSLLKIPTEMFLSRFSQVTALFSSSQSDTLTATRSTASDFSILFNQYPRYLTPIPTVKNFPRRRSKAYSLSQEILKSKPYHITKPISSPIVP